MATKASLKKLKASRASLNARIQALEARLKQKEQKAEIRRQILVGAYYLSEARQHQTMDALIEAIEPTLKRTSDRLLFGLGDKVDVQCKSTEQ